VEDTDSEETIAAVSKRRPRTSAIEEYRVRGHYVTGILTFYSDGHHNKISKFKTVLTYVPSCCKDVCILDTYILFLNKAYVRMYMPGSDVNAIVI